MLHTSFAIITLVTIPLIDARNAARSVVVAFSTVCTLVTYAPVSGRLNEHSTWT